MRGGRRSEGQLVPREGGGFIDGATGGQENKLLEDKLSLDLPPPARNITESG